ncbi:hypothetical protein BSR28_01335 [Boudabousia liubingyangii]|uniref:glycerophosphodiester phosphodiesterase n=1 Tax=Boudabousia liubingyangii TaxID=1921764 RepID=UPI00093FF91D|nr:glycerophosphodiester phosphodiesterase family protein [Boudabousia liubingyangii]OKL48374.1 hypothetical protein BSR28_01335 [Boudabousia liubingyangii]
MYELRENFLLTAHRGAVDVAPENTVLAFQEAEKLGIQECELDVQYTKDGKLVVGHDQTFERLALGNAPGKFLAIEDQTYDQLLEVDLGLGQKVPTFDEVLESTSCLLQVEIKKPRAARPLAEYLATRSQSVRDRMVITSFHAEAIAEYQKYGKPGERGTGLLIWRFLEEDWRYEVDRLGVKNLFMHWPGLTREFVDQLRAEGFKVCASMFNFAGDLQHILETGVEGSSTDKPRFAQALLESVKRK